MSDCSESDQLDYEGMAYYCAAPEACEEFFKFGDGNNVAIQDFNILPEQFQFHPAYPNPFNPSTDIGFSLGLSGSVSISIYNVLGRHVDTILENEYRNTGSHIISWNGSKFPSGIYFVHSQFGKQMAVQKITLLK